jgi:hypothetical protein
MPASRDYTGVIHDPLTGAALTVKRAFASVAAGTTDGPVVAAVAGKKLRVLAFILMAAATATLATFNSKGAGAGVAISPAYPCAINGGLAPPYNVHGWLETSAGEGLTLTTGAGSTVVVQVVYVEVLA